jgi:hypothetical protein
MKTYENRGNNCSLSERQIIWLAQDHPEREAGSTQKGANYFRNDQTVNDSASMPLCWGSAVNFGHDCNADDALESTMLHVKGFP